MNQQGCLIQGVGSSTRFAPSLCDLARFTAHANLVPWPLSIWFNLVCCCCPSRYAIYYYLPSDSVYRSNCIHCNVFCTTIHRSFVISSFCPLPKSEFTSNYIICTVFVQFKRKQENILRITS